MVLGELYHGTTTLIWQSRAPGLCTGQNGGWRHSVSQQLPHCGGLEKTCACVCVCVFVPRTFVWVFVSPTWSCGYAAMATTGSLLRPGSEWVCPAVCYVSELMQVSVRQKNLHRRQRRLYLLVSFGTLLSVQYNVMTAVVRLHANKQPCVMKSVWK